MRKIIALLALLACWTPVSAQEVSIQAAAEPRQAGVGETIRLEITIQGQVNIQGEPALPDLSDFQVYGGGRSSDFRVVNGQMSSALKFTYMLVPKHTGQCTIGPVTITHNGQTYSTAPIAITVGSGSGGGAAPGAPAAGIAPPSSPAVSGHAGEPVFITTSLDRHEVFVNQPVTLTFRFFTRIPILAQPQYQKPDLSGFWAEDLPPQRNYVAQIGGQEYSVIEIKTALFPSTAGKLIIGPAALLVQVEDFSRQRVDPFADSFFRNFFTSARQVSLRSDPITLQVKPIPTTGRPGDFSGTVGEWSFSAKLDRKEARVGEGVTLEVRVFGEGNVKSIGKPQLPPFPGFRIYETISSSEVQNQNGRVRGVKTYRTLLRPEVTGPLTLPPLRYGYFNPNTAKFEQIEVPGLALKVLPGDGAAALPPAGPQASPETPGGPGVKVVSRDIRYLKLRVPLNRASAPLSPWFLLLGFGLPPLALLAAWAGQRQRERLAADPVFARRQAAARRAKQALHQARAARLRRDGAAFYSSLSQALTGYLADQLGLSRAGVTQRELLRRLTDAGAEAAALEKLTTLLDECDYARFAPGQRDAAAWERHEREAETLLTEVGNVLAKEKKT